MSVNKFREEVAAGQRFEFGKNWEIFLANLMMNVFLFPSRHYQIC